MRSMMRGWTPTFGLLDKVEAMAPARIADSPLEIAVLKRLLELLQTASGFAIGIFAASVKIVHSFHT